MQQPASAPDVSAGTPAKLRFGRGGFIALALFIALLLGYGYSFFQVSAYEAGITRQTLTVTGTVPVPVIHLVPTSRRGNAIAIIVHGYAGSKELMLGFGLELARMGVPSYLLDLPGHGESSVPLDTQTSNQQISQLETALDEVVTHARTHSDVAQPKIILLGHSLGTEVVGKYALNHPNAAIAATILVSPILQEMPGLTHPANLLVIVGENDIPSILTLSPQIIGAGCGVSLPATTKQYACGNASQGSARRLVLAPGVNHITILTDPDAFRAMGAWVGATDAIPPVPVESDTRLHWTELGVACAFLAIFPLISLLVRLFTLRAPGVLQARSQKVPIEQARSPALWVGLGILALSVGLTVVLLRSWAAAADALQLSALRTPLSWVGITLADYSASFALVLALIAGGLVYAIRRWLPRPSFTHLWRQLLLGVVVFLFLYAAIGTLATYAWERFLLDQPRVLRGIPLTIAVAPLFFLIEGVFAPDERDRLWRSGLARLAAYLLIVAGTIGAIALDSSLGFLSLLIPIQVLLFLAFAALAWYQNRQRQQLNLSIAVTTTLLFSWAIVAVFPIIR